MGNLPPFSSCVFYVRAWESFGEEREKYEEKSLFPPNKTGISKEFKVCFWEKLANFGVGLQRKRKCRAGKGRKAETKKDLFCCRTAKREKEEEDL